MDYRDLQGLGTGGVLGMASILCTIHGFHPVHNPESNVDLFEDPTFLLQIGVESRVRLPACGGKYGGQVVLNWSRAAKSMSQNRLI